MFFIRKTTGTKGIFGRAPPLLPGRPKDFKAKPDCRVETCGAFFNEPLGDGLSTLPDAHQAALLANPESL